MTTVKFEIHGSALNEEERKDDKGIGNVVVGLLNKLDDSPLGPSVDEIDTVITGFSMEVREVLEDIQAAYGFDVVANDMYLNDWEDNDDFDGFGDAANRRNWTLMNEEADKYPTADIVVLGMDRSKMGTAEAQDARQFDTPVLELSTEEFIDAEEAFYGDYSSSEEEQEEQEESEPSAQAAEAEAVAGAPA